MENSRVEKSRKLILLGFRVSENFEFSTSPDSSCVRTETSTICTFQTAKEETSKDGAAATCFDLAVYYWETQQKLGVNKEPRSIKTASWGT